MARKTSTARGRRIVRQDECADYLAVEERTLEAWRYRGGGPPYIRLGRRAVRYDLDRVDRWLGERERLSTSEGSGGGRPAA